MVVKNKLHPDVPAWEVEIPDLGINAKNLQYKLQDGSLFRKITTRFENHNENLKNKILNALDIDYIKKQIPNYKEIDIKIFKDLPGFKLWPHLDIKDHKGFIVINLTIPSVFNLTSSSVMFIFANVGFGSIELNIIFPNFFIEFIL